VSSHHSIEWFVIPAMVALAIVGRLIAGSMDRERIRRYIQERGGNVLDITWAPFGPGWFGARERIYSVCYRNSEGKTEDVYCKTSMWSGVYFAGED